MTREQLSYIKSNLHISNRELSERLGISYYSIRYFLDKYNIKRNENQLEQIKKRVGEAQRGENNPNWKDGISNDNYHYKKIQLKRYPEKIKAREKVYRAKQKGELIPEPCFVCGTTEDIEAHHPSYEQGKELAVIWVCREHHREIENEGSLFTGEIK